MINFSTWDVIVIFMLGAFIFLGPFVCMLVGLWLRNRGYKWTGVVLVGLPLAYLMIPNAKAGVQYLQMRSYSQSQWHIPEAPLAADGKRVLCLSSEGEIRGTCKAILTYGAPSDMVVMAVPYEFEGLDRFEMSEITALRATLVHENFNGYETTHVEYTPVSDVVGIKDFDLVILETSAWGDRENEVPNDLYVRFTRIYDGAHPDAPLAQMANAHASLEYGIAWMFGGRVYFPNDKALSEAWAVYICGADTGPLCSGY